MKLQRIFAHLYFITGELLVQNNILLPAVPKDNGEIIISLSSSNFISFIQFFTSEMLTGS